jgi:hypothetical protein
MKRFTFALFAMAAALLFSSTAAAQVPAVVPVQGILNAADGTPVDGDTPLTFSLYDNDDNQLWTETFSVTVDNGFFTVGLGAGNTALDLSIFENNTRIQLGIQVGSDPEMSPRMNIGSVPFALRAQLSDQALEALNSGTLEGQSLADLDARFLSDVPDNSVTTNKIASSAVTADKLANAVTIYEVTSLFCELPPGSLSTESQCYARQDNVESCTNNCGGTLQQFRVRNCQGNCACATLLLCLPGQPCNPRGSLPRCPNTQLGTLVGN